MHGWRRRQRCVMTSANTVELLDVELEIFEVLVGAVTDDAAVAGLVLHAPADLLQAVHAPHVRLQVGLLAVRAVAHVTRVARLHVVHDDLMTPQLARRVEALRTRFAVRLEFIK